MEPRGNRIMDTPVAQKSAALGTVRDSMSYGCKVRLLSHLFVALF